MSLPAGGGYPGGQPGPAGGAPQTQPYAEPAAPGGGGFQPGPGYTQAGGHQGGPGVGDRAQAAAQSVARHVKTPETKEFFRTSEFFVWALTVVGILIAAMSVSEGKGHDFAAAQAWLYVAIVSFAYIISRGISKAGTRRGYGDAPFDRGDGGAPFQ